MLILSLSFASFAPASEAGHGGAVPGVLLALAVILTAAKLGGELAQRIGQPAVLGELVGGIVIGNLHLAGIGWFEAFATDPTIDVVAQLGVVILLFEVGLESTVRDMLRVGRAATFVAVLGVITPFALGWGVGAWLLSGHSAYVRGEVGLIFAGIGLTLSIGGEPVIDQAVFSASVIMVIVTTMITPPALKWSLARTASPSTQ